MPSIVKSQWFWRDWDSEPTLRLVSFAAQGLWMRMLCIAAASPRPGFVMVLPDRGCSVEEIAQLTGGTVEEVSQLVLELEKGGVFSRDSEKVIFCRRMVAETARLRQFREAGKKGGRPPKLLIEKAEKHNPTLLKKNNPTLSENENPTLFRGVSRPRARVESDIFLSKGSDSLPDSEKEDLQGDSARAREAETIFETFWRAYPRREDKGHARRAFAKAITKVSSEVLVAAATRYAQRRVGQEQKYTALPSTWLNGERWLDEEQPSIRAVGSFGSPGFA